MYSKANGSKRTAVIVVLALVLALAGLAAAYTPAGTQISNQATATYKAGGVERSSASNIVYVMIEQIAGVEVGPDAAQNRQVVAGQIVQHVYTLKNTGNASDEFELDAIFDGGDYEPDVTWYHDVNENGVINAGDHKIDDTITVGAGQEVHIIARFTVPSGAIPNQTIVLKLLATSDFESTESDQSETVTFTALDQDVVTAVLERDRAVAQQGDDITYTIRVTNQSSGTINNIIVDLNIPENTTAKDDSLVVNQVLVDGALPATHTIDSLVLGQTAVVEYTVTIDGTAPADYITNKVEIQAGSATAFDTNEVRTSVEHAAGVSLSLVASSHPVPVNPTQAGHEYTFTYQVTNDGNGPDTFYISTSLTDADDVPANWTVQLYQSDGVTPLPQQNGKYTVGHLPADGTANFVVKVTVPVSVVGGSGPFTLETKATSASNPSVFDPETGMFENIEGAVVIVTAGPTPTPGKDVPDPGATVEYPVKISNDGPTDDVIDLSSEDFPSGSIVEFFDENGNPITEVPLGPNEETTIYVRITIPDDAEPNDNAGGKVIGTSRNNGESDDSDIVITVNDYVDFTVAPPRIGSVNQGSFAVYEFEITNDSNSNKAFTLAISGNERLSYAILDDANNSITAPITINKGDRATVKVRVSADHTVAVGWTESVQLQATTGGETRSASLTTTVIGAELSMEKSAATNHPDGDDKQVPGEDIVYTVEVTNVSVAPLEDVVIYEAIPAHTVFKAQSIDVDPADVTIEYSIDGGTTWTTTEPDAEDITNIRWKLDNDLPVNDTVTVILTVTVE